MEGQSILKPAERRTAGLSTESDAPRRWRADCRAFAREVVKVKPDRWQDLFFAAVSGITEPGMAQAKPRVALKACKGPGKSFALAIVIWWWLMTRWHANTVAMSITEDNLKTNLWPELARIRERSVALQMAFNQTAEQITAKKYEQTWFCKVRSFPQNADKTQQANTIAGLHGRHPAIFCDEVGDYPDGVIVASEAIFSTLVDGKPVEALLAMCGNPTRTDGPLYRVATDPNSKKNWWTHSISGDPADPDRSPRIDPVWAQDQIDQWGRDNDFIKVNILGQFPSQQSNKLLSPEEVAESAGRVLDPRSVKGEPVIMALDVARYGDNESVLTRRQGNQIFTQRKWRNYDLMTLADQVVSEVLTHSPAVVTVDQTGLGAGVVDRMRQLGVNVIGIDPGGAAVDPKFFDRRAEMYWKLATWIRRGGAIPNVLSLRSQLVAPMFEYKTIGKTTKFVLESKKDMAKRGVSSPDEADSAAMTFATEVVGALPMRHGSEEELLNRLAPVNQKIVGGTEESWDPFAGD